MSQGSKNVSEMFWNRDHYLPAPAVNHKGVDFLNPDNERGVGHEEKLITFLPLRILLDHKFQGVHGLI